MQFAHPSYFWLFLLYAPIIAWYVLKHKRLRPSLGISTSSPFAGIGRSWREYAMHAMLPLRLAAIGCLIFILARPQVHDSWRTTSTDGTDIVLALDVSSSMLARDFKPNRLEAAKDVAATFVSQRDGDNIGIVIFAGESLTGVPMTVDKRILSNYVNSINMDILPDGTAIGDGIATSLNRLKEGNAKSKSIILITDGSNNTGLVSPLTAASVATEMGVRIYTIGVGTNGMADMPVSTPYGIRYEPQKVVIDEATLMQIADMTGAKYFRATGNKVLEEVFKEIDSLEKTHMNVHHFTHAEDNYMPFAWALIIIFLLELVIRYTVARSMP